jgi:hypothetical protein
LAAAQAKRETSSFSSSFDESSEVTWVGIVRFRPPRQPLLVRLKVGAAFFLASGAHRAFRKTRLIALIRA